MVVLRQKLLSLSAGSFGVKGGLQVNLRLRASVVGTSVRSFTRVNSTMTSQAGRVRELLSAARIQAAVRFLASVSSDVNVQCAALDESLVATGLLALEWPRLCVDAVMSLQVGFAVEGLSTLDPVAWPGARGRLCVHDF